MKKILTILASITFIGLCLQPLSVAAQEAAESMSFFVTSVGPGSGAETLPMHGSRMKNHRLRDVAQERGYRL